MIQPAIDSSFTKLVNSHEMTITLRSHREELQIKVKDHQNESMLQQNQIHKFSQFHTTNNAKSMISNKPSKFFISKFKYETLPLQCQYLFKNVREVYQAFKNSQTISLQNKENRIQIALKLDITRKQKTFSKYIFFLLDYIEYFHSQSHSQCQQSSNKIKSGQSEYQRALQLENQLLKRRLVEVVQKFDGPLQAAQKIKKTVQGIERFVNEFVSRIKQKWTKVTNQHQQKKKTIEQLRISQKVQLTAQVVSKNIHPPSPSLSFKSPSCLPFSITQNLGNGQSKNDSNHKKIQKMKIQPKSSHDSCPILKLNYTLSSKYKSDGIHLISSMKARCVSMTTNYKVIMIHPLSFQTLQRPQQQNYQAIVRINELGSYIAFGICEKQHIIKKNFQLSQTESRGCYVLDWSGNIWSSYRQKHISKYASRVKEIREGDVIKMTFKCSERTLYFSNFTWDKPRYININPQTNLCDLCFCAIMQGGGDQVEILGTKPAYVVIDLTSSKQKNNKKEQSEDQI